VEEPLSAEEVLRNAEAVLAQVDAANEFISNGWIAIAPPPQGRAEAPRLPSLARAIDRGTINSVFIYHTRDPSVLLIQTSFCLDKLWPAAGRGTAFVRQTDVTDVTAARV
jgi:hypothetical protein